MLLQTMKRFPFTSALIVLALFFQTVPLQGQTAGRFKISGTLSATDLGSWRTIQKGVEQRKIAFLRSEPNYTLELRLLRFDPKIISARILSSGDFQLKGATAKDFVEKSGAIAAINANYFDERGRPLAYLKTGEQRDQSRTSPNTHSTPAFSRSLMAIRRSCTATISRRPRRAKRSSPGHCC